MQAIARDKAREKAYDAILIGGGFYGCCLALALRKRLSRILILEREAELLTGASFANQARVHNGYHYPRSLLTALRSAANYPRFTAEFGDCLSGDFEQVYAIARATSKVNGYQFRKFCEQVGIAARPAPQSVLKLFNPALIETAFLTEECAFDAVKLRRRLRSKLAEAGITVAYREAAESVLPGAENSVRIQTTGRRELTARHVFNCTYSDINRLLIRSALPPLPLKHELAEMALIEPPNPLKHLGITVMDGPFFSTMPFPSRGLHTLSHVRYTPHHAWNDGGDSKDGILDATPPSNSIFMLRDAQRYLPCLRDARPAGSLFQTKTVLLQNEVDDGRPILCRADYGIPNLFVILGAKIDNIYDILETMERRDLVPDSMIPSDSAFNTLAQRPVL